MGALNVFECSGSACFGYALILVIIIYALIGIPFYWFNRKIKVEKLLNPKQKKRLNIYLIAGASIALILMLFGVSYFEYFISTFGEIILIGSSIILLFSSGSLLYLNAEKIELFREKYLFHFKILHRYNVWIWKFIGFSFSLGAVIVFLFWIIRSIVL